MLKTLYIWSDDNDVFEEVEKIALSKDVEEFYKYPNGIGQKAWEVYIKGTITKRGIVKEEDSIMYVLEFMEDLRGRLFRNTIEHVKYLAAFAVLQRYDRDTLFSLAGKLEEYLKVIETQEPDSELDVRTRCMLGCIKAALKEKAKKLTEPQRGALDR